jgi:hypothetical protein
MHTMHPASGNPFLSTFVHPLQSPFSNHS